MDGCRQAQLAVNGRQPASLPSNPILLLGRARAHCAATLLLFQLVSVACSCPSSSPFHILDPADWRHAAVCNLAYIHGRSLEV